mgnify:CR=1 FL=1
MDQIDLACRASDGDSILTWWVLVIQVVDLVYRENGHTIRILVVKDAIEIEISASNPRCNVCVNSAHTCASVCHTALSRLNHKLLNFKPHNFTCVAVLLGRNLAAWSHVDELSIIAVDLEVEGE